MGSCAATERRLYKRILVATDGSPLAQRGIDHGLRLAKLLGASVTFVVASELFTGITLEGEPPTSLFAGEASLMRASRAAADKILAKCRQLADEQGVSCDLVHVEDKIPAAAIVETSDARGCDLVVMSSHGWRGVGRLLLGSQASEVAARSKVPVLIVKDAYKGAG